ncbi:MAG: flagellar basal body-associated FliL family protein [Pseudomonadota bacterium]
MTDVTMAEADEDAEASEGRKSKLPIILGVVLLLVGAGGGFFATFSGIVALPFGGGEDVVEEPMEKAAELAGVAYLSLDEMIIPLSPNARARYLAFKAEIEVRKEDIAAFEEIRPRIVDVFNTYLRAIEEADLEAPSAAARLRAQLLRRIRVVAAPAEPRDLLITSFVLK